MMWNTRFVLNRSEFIIENQSFTQSRFPSMKWWIRQVLFPLFHDINHHLSRLITLQIETKYVSLTNWRKTTGIYEKKSICNGKWFQNNLRTAIAFIDENSFEMFWKIMSLLESILHHLIIMNQSIFS